MSEKFYCFRCIGQNAEKVICEMISETVHILELEKLGL